MSQLNAFRAERTLLEGDIQGLSPSEIRRLGLMAWDDLKTAHSFAARVLRERLERGGDNGE